MSRTLFLRVSPGEIWAALAEKGALEGLRVLRAGAAGTGGIFLGRIVALRPELPAALIEIGLERPGFLDARDADPRRGLTGLTEGAELMVELIKEPRVDKAAGLRVLRKDDPRRAAAENAARAAKPPARLDVPTSPVAAALRAFLPAGLDRLVVDDRAGLAEARALLSVKHPDLSQRLEFYAGDEPLFEDAGLAAAIEAVLQPQVALARGGTLHIEATHAATLIDVDSGKAQAVAANLDAAREAARQIRLRNLGGPIVIDFVGMKSAADRAGVLGALKDALAADAEKTEILGWTRLGHVELTRRRRGASLAEILLEPVPGGPMRKTAITLALEALRAAARETRAQPGRALALAAHSEVIAALATGEGRAARAALEASLGRPLALTAEAGLAREAFDIRPV